MKSFLVPSIVVALHCIGALSAGAAGQNVIIEMQVVAMPEELALPLVAELRDPTKIEPAYAKVQELIAQKKAQLLGWPILHTASGQRAVAEQIDEVRYAVEFVPADPQPEPEPSADAPQKKAAEPKPKPPVRDLFPRTFETRNVGVTLEVEPSVGEDGKLISLNLVPQHVQLLGYTKTTAKRGSIETTVEQPEFFTAKLTTSMTLRNGERRLIAVYKVPQPPNSIELFILKAATEAVE